MTHEERASVLVDRMEANESFDLWVSLVSAFAAVERETLERAAEWHDERVVAFQELYDDDSRPDDLRLGLLWKRDAHEESAVAIRALAGQPQEATDNGGGAVTVGAAGGNGSPSALRMAEDGW